MKNLTALRIAVCCGLVVCVLVPVGCVRKVDDGKIPITTTSDEARSEFLKGRELTDKLLGTDALAHYDKAISLDPKFALAYLNRANVSPTAKEFFRHLNQAVGSTAGVSEGEKLLILAAEAGANAEPSKQREYLEKLVAAYPRDERARFAAGAFYFGLQEYDKAIEHLKTSIELAPNFSPSYNMLGYSYRQVENYSRAGEIFKKYTELIPNDPNPYDSYAELLMKEGKFDESIANYRKALAADPNFIASYAGIAANYMYKGMYDDAMAELDKLAKAARTEGEIRFGMFTETVLFVDAGRMDDAVRKMDEQFALAEKKNDAGQMAADLGFKANILLEMGKLEDARTAFDRALKVTSESGLSGEIKENAQLLHHFNVGVVALAGGDLKKAKTEDEIFRKGVEEGKNPNQIRLAHELSGRIALAEKEYDKAIASLQQANLQNPYNLYRIAMAYKGKKDETMAREFLGKAANFDGLPALNYAFIRTKAGKMLTGA